MRAYHVTERKNWQQIQESGIRSFDRLVEDGEAPDWKWDEAPEGHDGYWVSLFRAGQREELGWFLEDGWVDNPIIIELDLPEDGSLRIGTNDEGYLSVAHHIPAEYIVGLVN